MNVNRYQTLFRKMKEQPAHEYFAFFPPEHDRLTRIPDYDAAWLKLAEITLEGKEAWDFTTDRYRKRWRESCPKLRNYLQYTFVRLTQLEQRDSGRYFLESSDLQWVCFNTGLQDKHSVDLYSIFERNQDRRPETQQTPRPDWLYRGTVTARDSAFRGHFGTSKPELAWYSQDSRDFIFDLSYQLDADVFDHMFERAKERSGVPDDASDEAVRNYLRGTIDNLLPKIRRNYKTAIPMFYVEEARMQLLLPFVSYSGRETACLLIERDDSHRCYTIKTVLDQDQAFFAARLLTRPDKEWLNP